MDISSVRMVRLTKVITMMGISMKVEVIVRVVCLLMNMIMSMVIHWLHFKNEVTCGSIDIGWIENRTIGLESTTCFVPSATVESIEVISPVEFELVVMLVVGENLNVVIEYIPWHVSWVESLTP